MSKQEHEFGDGRFRRTVVTAYHAGLHQLVAGFITFHFYNSGTTLGDIDNHDSLFACLLQAVYEPFFAGSIA